MEDEKEEIFKNQKEMKRSEEFTWNQQILKMGKEAPIYA